MVMCACTKRTLRRSKRSSRQARSRAPRPTLSLRRKCRVPDAIRYTRCTWTGVEGMLAINKVAITSIVSLLVLAGAAASENGTVTAVEDDTPHYTAAGDLQVPARFREWVFLSS